MVDWILKMPRSLLRSALAASLAAVVLSLVSGAANPANAGVASPSSTTAAPTAAKLRLVITSTAAVANVHLAPGQVTARVDRSLAGGATTAYV
ncbi:MAG: hypothetical protein QOH64_2389, partial [Acidimicrobiaceae bacterium]